MDDVWCMREVVTYVTERGCKRVTLQFPDDMLEDAPTVAQALQRELSACSDAKVYVLADTTYNPLSVDEVAAQHVNADCVIHYGHASLTPVTRTPALCVLPRAPLDVPACSRHVVAALAEHGGAVGGEAGEREQQQGAADGSGRPWALVVFDQAYAHHVPQLRQQLAEDYQGPLEVVFADVAPTRLDPPKASPSSTRAPAGGGGGGCCRGTDCSSGGGDTGTSAGARADEGAAAGCGRAGAGCSGGAGQACSSGGTQHEGSGTAEAETMEPGSSSGGSGGRYAPPPLGGLVWAAPAASAGAPPRAMLWLGPPRGAALTHLQLTHSGARWVGVDPAGGFATSTGLCDGLDRLLRRRYFLVEKARGASILGLLVGTLGAAGYLEALEALRRLAAQAGKKTYTLLMGKPSPAKLANFPEVEVFVMVAEPQGLILDSKEFLAPIITPHEALLALDGRPLEAGSYRLDYGELLAWDASRRRGGAAAMRAEAAAAARWPGGKGSEEEELESGGGGALVAAGGLQLGSAGAGGAGQRQVAARSAAEYLTAARTFRGLETPATGAEIKPAELAVAGRSGRAAKYVDEPSAAGGTGAAERQRRAEGS